MLLFVVFSYTLHAQAYVGIQGEYGDKAGCGAVIMQEIDTAHILFQFRTIINDDPRFQMKMGWKILKGKFSPVVYLPVFNLSLSEMAYNTPINVELRYKLQPYLFIAGMEYYTDKPLYYLNIFIQFK